MKDIKNKVLQIINNKNFKRIAIVVILFALIFGFYKSISNSNKDLILVNNRIDRRQFQIYKQKSDKSGYDKIDTGTFPSGYKLNMSLSHCEDNNNNSVDISSILSYSDGKAEVTSNKTIMCTLYLDEINTFYRILASKSDETNPLVKEYQGEGWVGTANAEDRFFTSHIYSWYVPSGSYGGHTQAENVSTVKNGWNVVFAGYCWQILRTTENEGIKLIYNGVPDIGESNGVTTYDCSENRSLYHMGEMEKEYNISGSKKYADSYTSSTSGSTTTYTLVNNDSSTPGTINITASNASSVVGKYTCGNTSTTCTNNNLRKIVSIKEGTTANVINSTYRGNIGNSAFNSSSSSFSLMGYMYNEIYSHSVSYLYSKEETGVDSMNINSTSLNYYYSDSYLSGTNAYTYCSGGSASNIEGNHTCYALAGTPLQGSAIVDPTNSGTPDYSNLIGKYTLQSSFSSQNTSSAIYYVVGYSDTYIYLIKVEKNHPLTYYQKSYYFSQNVENGVLQNPTEVKNFVTQAELQTDQTSWQNTWPFVYSNYSDSNVCITGNSCFSGHTTQSYYGYFIYYDATNPYKFSNTITYDTNTNKYTIHMSDDPDMNLRDSNAVSIWDLSQATEYNKIGKAHYVCLDGNNVPAKNTLECSSVGFVFYRDGNKYYYYFPLSSGKYFSTDESNSNVFNNDNNILYASLYKSNVNNTSSLIKSRIDKWYEEYLLNSPEEALIDSEEIFCGSRKIRAYGNFAPDSANITGSLSFYYNSSLSCPNKLDAYSKTETTRGNGALLYPVGLISAYEYNMLSSVPYTLLGENYFYHISPYMYNNNTYVYVNAGSILSLDNERGVRPSIALKGNVEPSRGTGSMTDPYVVEVSNS